MTYDTHKEFTPTLVQYTSFRIFRPITLYPDRIYWQLNETYSGQGINGKDIGCRDLHIHYTEVETIRGSTRAKLWAGLHLYIEHIHRS